MGLFKKLTKPIKKALKSDLGKLAAAWATYRYAPQMWGDQLGGQGGWKAGWEKFAPYVLGTPSENVNYEVMGRPMQKTIPGTGNLWQRSGIMGKSAIVGTGAALAGAATMPDEDLPEEILDDSGQRQYLANRS